MDYIVNTPCGKVKGEEGIVEGTAAYKGIRYATAGRWEHPVEVTSWEGVYDARKYGDCCYQPRSFHDEEYNPKKYFYYNEFRKGESYTYSEDCLFLNIWTPDTAKEGDKLPVIVYIHGGGFTGGCAHEKHFDGPVWPSRGVIAVTINYRLGPMGFACFPELQKEIGHTGNYGLYDQMTAIKWVKANIEAFGGNSDNITIMGQSAGAISVQHLCMSPLTDGLFHKAVMSSGCGTNNILTGSLEKSYPLWEEVMKKLECDCVDELREVPAEKLFEVWQETKKHVKGGNIATFPVKDEFFIVSEAKAKDIPYMVGSTSHDMMPPILYSMGTKWCINNGSHNFGWFFDRKLPGDKNGAWHSSDLWYWFGTLDNCWRPMVEKDYQLSQQMVDYLCNFAKHGNPNGEELPIWNPCCKTNKSVIRLGEGNTRMGKANMAKLAVTMVTNKSVGE